MLGRLRVACAVGLAGLVSVVGAATQTASATTGVDPLQRVSVRILDGRLVVSPKRVERAITIWFRVVNKGKKTHNFVVSGLKTKPLGPGQVDHIVLSFEDRGNYMYRCALNCTRNMRGQVVVFSGLGN
ncbi:MAG TPA: cupredoxin domain-containing protein [Gaiella sp.]|jgi:plastocyanin